MGKVSCDWSELCGHLYADEKNTCDFLLDLKSAERSLLDGNQSKNADLEASSANSRFAN